MFNFFRPKKKEMNLIYPEIEVSKRINKIIEDYILPKIQHLGFKLVKSESELVRYIGDFKQTIYVQKSKTNNQNNCIKFKLIFKVEYVEYKKWFKKKYNEKLYDDYRLNDITMWAIHDQIPNWQENINSPNWYDLMSRDNYEIVDEVNKKILNVAIPFMDEFSGLEKAISKNIELERYNKIPMLLDFCEIIDDKEKAMEIKEWYNSNSSGKNHKLEIEITNEIEKRIKNLKD